ncbi:uncharacterized protein N7496_006229 [Penicillium cataractarum]|uniref:Uncharacterized protein n=1 Tax=Penicillium cataractarum TaxID=2100454 RepID=A0A9W9V650_9EURO|nr:uncharacterized protein N7496_006229 [Penicillium cataractarum]KAJ5370137.1 hypothetical protein N7496_006229 [Penicillium cataractarum]
MLLQTLITTLLPAVALAIPASQTTSNDGEDAYGIPSSVIATIFNDPSSIDAAYFEASLTTWLSYVANHPAFASSVLAEEEAGIKPSWYSNEPESVKEYFSTRDEAIESYYAKASSSYCATASVLTTDISGTVVPLCTAGSEADSTSGSSITSNSASASGSQLGSTSTGGVPAAATGLAMGLAGTMAILGLAVAL